MPLWIDCAKIGSFLKYRLDKFGTRQTTGLTNRLRTLCPCQSAWRRHKKLLVHFHKILEGGRFSEKKELIRFLAPKSNQFFLFSKPNLMLAKVLWTCVLQDQKKFQSDSVHVAPLETAGIITVKMIPYCGPMSYGTWGCLGVVGVSVWGLALLVVGFSCVSKYIALLISSLPTAMTGAAPSTRLMRALNLRGSCSRLGERKGS